MKLLKRFLLTLTIVLGMSLGAAAQSGWSSGQYYASRGGSSTTCGYSYTVTKTDGWGNYWNETWKDCQKRNWHQEYRSGYVYYWGNNGWYSEYKSGYFWYFTWYNYSKRVG